MSFIKLEPVYFNSPLGEKTHQYLKNQKYLKYKNIKKFIHNYFLKDYPFGFVILDENKNICGFLGTMFSSRFDNKENYLYCNLHTWIVDEDKRFYFFSESKKILKPIFNYNASFFAKPVKGLIRLFERFYDMQVINMKYRISFLPKPSIFFNNHEFEIIDDAKVVSEKLNQIDLKIFNDHKNLNCYKFLICKKGSGNNYLFVVATKKKKKYIFNVLELIYVSNIKIFRDNWENLIFNIYKKFKVMFCAQNYLIEEECCIPVKNKLLNDLNSQIVIKNLPQNFKFNTLYSEFVY